MRIVKVNSHRTNDVFVFCKTCGVRCIAPKEMTIHNGGYTGGAALPRAYADLDDIPGTFYCQGHAHSLDPKIEIGTKGGVIVR